MRIIVLDCYERMGLAVANALGSSYELIGGMPSRQGIWLPPFERVLKSHRFETMFRYPDPRHDRSRFFEAVALACRRYRADAVFPATTASSTALAAALAEPGRSLGAVVVGEPWERLRLFADKWRTYLLCQRFGIPTPRTVLPAGDGLDELDELSLPVVWKPRLLEASQGVRVVTTKAELWDLVGNPPPVPDVEPGEFPYLVQEYVSGKLHDAATCAQAGRPVSMSTQRRIVTRFRHGGPSIVSETTHEPDLMEHARRLLGALKWNGPALFEFLRRPTGDPLLLEVNARVWGGTQLTVAAGQNVCEQAIDIFVRDRPVEPLTEYELGLRCKWLTPGTLIRALTSSEDRREIVGRGPGGVVTNLQWRDLPHLTGMTAETAANRVGRLLHPPLTRALGGTARRRDTSRPPWIAESMTSERADRSRPPASVGARQGDHAAMLLSGLPGNDSSEQRDR
jgi:hypothetical protein